MSLEGKGKRHRQSQGYKKKRFLTKESYQADAREGGKNVRGEKRHVVGTSLPKGVARGGGGTIENEYTV